MTTLLAAHPPTANDRFKESFGARLWLSLILATMLHALPFRFFPAFEAADWTPPGPEAAQVVKMPKTELPPRPADVRRPAAPVISMDVAADETLPVFSWEEVKRNPPPPPAAVQESPGSGIAFVPYTVPPGLLNPREVARALEREYPAHLRDSGIGGTTELLIHIDTEGRMTEARIGKGSGYDALDRAALRVAEAMRFRPAMNRDTKVAVWIRQPVTFTVR